MSTILPTDMNNQVIPAMRFKEGGAHVVTASVSSQRNASAFNDDTMVLSMYSDVPVYVAFGDADVSASASASDHYFPAHVYYDLLIGDMGATSHDAYVAVMAVSDAGAVYISEKN